MNQNDVKKTFRFNVNKEKRTVACYLTMEDFLACVLYPMAEKYSTATQNYSAENAVWNMMLDGREHISEDDLCAVAKCNPKEDVFDEEFGKKLAQRRLETKLANLRKKICRKAADRFYKLYEYMNKKAFKNEQYALAREAGVEKLASEGPRK